MVGKSAVCVAEMAGVTVPSSTRLLISEESEEDLSGPFAKEKLFPALGFFTVGNWEQAIVLARRLLNLGGKGHTLAVHSHRHEVIRAFALACHASRIIVNTSSALGGIGVTTGLAPSLTLGCGTFGGSTTSDNVTASHLINVKRVAHGIPALGQEGDAGRTVQRQGSRIDQLPGYM